MDSNMLMFEQNEGFIPHNYVIGPLYVHSCKTGYNLKTIESQ